MPLMDFIITGICLIKQTIGSRVYKQVTTMPNQQQKLKEKQDKDWGIETMCFMKLPKTESIVSLGGNYVFQNFLHNVFGGREQQLGKQNGKRVQTASLK